MAKPSTGKKTHLRVLTYNLCFGCMSGDAKVARLDATGAPLAMHCALTGDGDTCLRQAARAIDSARPKPDIVLLQEATRHSVLASYSKTLSAMRGVASKADREESAVYFSPKFTLRARVSGDAGIYPERGRAFQIVVLTRQDNGTTYIVCNVHNGQGWRYGKTNLCKNLSSALDTIKEMPTLTSSSAPPVVVVGGDFNDVSGANFWAGFRPFDKSKISNGKLQHIKVQCSAKPPKSCCDASTSAALSRMHSIADYVMSGVGSPAINKVVKSRKLASDHWPVLARISHAHDKSVAAKQTKHKNKFTHKIEKEIVKLTGQMSKLMGYEVKIVKA